VVGELCIGGAGVANGYVGREDFTAERFVADPLGGRMYRTGDLVRRLPDCAVEFLGRVDGQVKIRGYRVEPGEVEAVLEGYDAVTQAAVVALPDPSGDLRLVAYVVGAVASSADVDTIRHHLAGTLPPHMVPSLILPIDAMPLTPNGKLDRRALPDPATIKLTDESSYVAPRDDVEVTLAAAWAELLGVERVGVEDDFFGLGGHSLLAAQVIARILRDFGVQLPLHSLFVAPTVASLAQLVREERISAAGGDDEFERMLGELEGMSDEQVNALLRDAPDGT
jgi:acyl carrier protein